VRTTGASMKGGRMLPPRPNLRHLKDQAKDLVKAGTATSIADAQCKIARLYGFPSWPKLKAHVVSLEQIGQLKEAIDTNDVARVKDLMSRNPELHRAPLGYGRSGPLTWVAECRVPWEPPGAARLAIATWTAIFHAVTQFGDTGLPMTQLLVARGADLAVRVKLPGHYERLDEFVECTPLGYARLFQNGSSDTHQGSTVAFLRERGALQ
jgi:hypothetical protein